ncbi:MAG: hypothetical protein V4494_06885 [Chlamydiota bacterium]
MDRSELSVNKLRTFRMIGFPFFFFLPGEHWSTTGAQNKKTLTTSDINHGV